VIGYSYLLLLAELCMLGRDWPSIWFLLLLLAECWKLEGDWPEIRDPTSDGSLQKINLERYLIKNLHRLVKNQENFSKRFFFSKLRPPSRNGVNM
jgi:hypothetical protein